MKKLVVLITSVALAMMLGCGKKDKDKGGKGGKPAAGAKGDKPGKPAEPDKAAEDKGPNSCDMVATKKNCMTYSGANSSAKEVESNCGAFKDAKFVKGDCPAEGILASCTEKLGPTTTKINYYEGADLAAEEKGCTDGGNTWEKK